MARSDSRTSRPRIVMVVAQDAAIDDRVRRQGLALVRSGFDVTLLTVGQDVMRAESRLGAVRVIRLPVPFEMRDARRQGMRRRRRWVPPVGHGHTMAARAQRARLRLARLEAASSRSPAVSNAVVAMRERTLSVSSLAFRVLRRVLRGGWWALDTTVDSVTVGASWRRRLPETDDYEMVFGPVLTRLGVDAFYVHGVELVGVVARASARAGIAGSQVPWVYDVDADVAQQQPDDTLTRRDLAAQVALEKDHVRYAARVVAVNEPLADILQRRNRLSSRPAVITTEDVAPISDLYLELLGVEGLQPRPEEPSDGVEELPVFPTRATGDGPLVGIGPANMAGQAWAWAKALERELPGTRTEVLMVDRGSPLIFPSDELVPAATYIRDVQWQEATRDRILSTWTHALMEAGRPLMGVMYGRTFAADARILEQAGVKVVLLFHGSELRDPRRHAAAHRWSPFRDTTDDWVQRVQATVDLLRPDIDAFTGPCLVSTPDLVKELTGATWLPVVVDCEMWTPRPERPEVAVPVVVHTPSRAAIKGSAFVEDALAPLVAQGLVEYRRVEGVPPEQMPRVLGDADIVLDQFAIGSYGVLACQAMATGTAVIGHVGSDVRAAVEQATGQVLPVIEATPQTLEQTLRQLVADPELRWAASQAGPAFIRSVHDGKRSAHILAEVLGIEPQVKNEGV